MTAPFVLATWSVQWLRQRLAHGVSAAAAEPAQPVDAARAATTPVQASRAS
jgi:urea transporter